MSLTLRFALFLAAIFAATALVYSAKGSEIGDFYHGLKQPDTGIGCCDISDCRAIKDYEIRGDQWWALADTIRHGPIWIPIPPNKILAPRERPPGIDPDEAILCAGLSSGIIFCFLPPEMGF